VENEVLGYGSLGYSRLWIELQQLRLNNRSSATSTQNFKSPIWLFLPALDCVSGCKCLATEVHFREGNSPQECDHRRGQEDFPGCTEQTRPGVAVTEAGVVAAVPQ